MFYPVVCRMRHWSHIPTHQILTKSIINRLKNATKIAVTIELEGSSISDCLAIVTAAAAVVAEKPPMWQVVTVPAKLGDAFGSLIRYAQESINIFFCPT